MQWRDADEWLDGWMGSDLHGLPGPFDIGGIGTGNGANFGIVYFGGDQAHRVKFSWRGDGKTAVECIEAHVSEGLCNRQFLFWKIVDAWGLFAITKRGFIKLDDAWFCCHRQSLLFKPTIGICRIIKRVGCSGELQGVECI